MIFEAEVVEVCNFINEQKHFFISGKNSLGEPVFWHDNEWKKDLASYFTYEPSTQRTLDALIDHGLATRKPYDPTRTDYGHGVVVEGGTKVLEVNDTEYDFNKVSVFIRVSAGGHSYWLDCEDAHLELTKDQYDTIYYILTGGECFGEGSSARENGQF